MAHSPCLQLSRSQARIRQLEDDKNKEEELRVFAESELESILAATSQVGMKGQRHGGKLVEWTGFGRNGALHFSPSTLEQGGAIPQHSAPTCGSANIANVKLGESALVSGSCAAYFTHD